MIVNCKLIIFMFSNRSIIVSI